MLLALFIFPFLEIFLIYKAVMTYSFVDVALWLVTAFVMGSIISSMLGRAALHEIQATMVQGKMPSNRLLRRGMVMFGGFLFMIPGLLSDFLAVLFILPGTRHLILWYLKGKLQNALKAGGVGNFGGIRFQTRVFRQGQEFREEPFAEERVERDAQVIDIKALSSERKNSED